MYIYRGLSFVLLGFLVAANANEMAQDLEHDAHSELEIADKSTSGSAGSGNLKQGHGIDRVKERSPTNDAISVNYDLSPGRSPFISQSDSAEPILISSGLSSNNGPSPAAGSGHSNVRTSTATSRYPNHRGRSSFMESGSGSALKESNEYSSHARKGSAHKEKPAPNSPHPTIEEQKPTTHSEDIHPLISRRDSGARQLQFLDNLRIGDNNAKLVLRGKSIEDLNRSPPIAFQALSDQNSQSTEFWGDSDTSENEITSRGPRATPCKLACVDLNCQRHCTCNRRGKVGCTSLYVVQDNLDHSPRHVDWDNENSTEYCRHRCRCIPVAQGPSTALKYPSMIRELLPAQKKGRSAVRTPHRLTRRMELEDPYDGDISDVSSAYTNRSKFTASERERMAIQSSDSSCGSKTASGSDIACFSEEKLYELVCFYRQCNKNCRCDQRGRVRCQSFVHRLHPSAPMPADDATHICRGCCKCKPSEYQRVDDVSSLKRKSSVDREQHLVKRPRLSLRWNKLDSTRESMTWQRLTRQEAQVRETSDSPSPDSDTSSDSDFNQRGRGLYNLESEVPECQHNCRCDAKGKIRCPTKELTSNCRRENWTGCACFRVRSGRYIAQLKRKSPKLRPRANGQDPSRKSSSEMPLSIRVEDAPEEPVHLSSDSSHSSFGKKISSDTELKVRPQRQRESGPYIFECISHGDISQRCKEKCRCDAEGELKCYPRASLKSEVGGAWLFPSETATLECRSVGCKCSAIGSELSKRSEITWGKHDMTDTGDSLTSKPNLIPRANEQIPPLGQPFPGFTLTSGSSSNSEHSSIGSRTASDDQVVPSPDHASPRRRVAPPEPSSTSALAVPLPTSPSPSTSISLSLVNSNLSPHSRSSSFGPSLSSVGFGTPSSSAPSSPRPEIWTLRCDIADECQGNCRCNSRGRVYCNTLPGLQYETTGKATAFCRRFCDCLEKDEVSPMVPGAPIKTPKKQVSRNESESESDGPPTREPKRRKTSIFGRSLPKNQHPLKPQHFIMARSPMLVRPGRDTLAHLALSTTKGQPLAFHMRCTILTPPAPWNCPVQCTCSSEGKLVCKDYVDQSTGKKMDAHLVHLFCREECSCHAPVMESSMTGTVSGMGITGTAEHVTGAVSSQPQLMTRKGRVLSLSPVPEGNSEEESEGSQGSQGPGSTQGSLSKSWTPPPSPPAAAEITPNLPVALASDKLSEDPKRQKTSNWEGRVHGGLTRRGRVNHPNYPLWEEGTHALGQAGGPVVETGARPSGADGGRVLLRLPSGATSPGILTIHVPNELGVLGVLGELHGSAKTDVRGSAIKTGQSHSSKQVFEGHIEKTRPLSIEEVLTGQIKRARRYRSSRAPEERIEGPGRFHSGEQARTSYLEDSTAATHSRGSEDESLLPTTSILHRVSVNDWEILGTPYGTSFGSATDDKGEEEDGSKRPLATGAGEATGTDILGLREEEKPVRKRIRWRGRKEG